MKKFISSFLILAIVLCSGCTNDLSANISYDEIFANGSFGLSFTNENDVTVDLIFLVKYLDENKKTIDEASVEIIGVEPDRIAVTDIGSINGNNNTYDTTEIEVIAKESNYETHFKEIQIGNGEDTGEIIQFPFTNNANETLEALTATIVYYNENEIVDVYPMYYGNIKPGYSGYLGFPYPTSGTFVAKEDIEFDSYKLFICEAHS